MVHSEEMVHRSRKGTRARRTSDGSTRSVDRSLVDFDSVALKIGPRTPVSAERSNAAAAVAAAGTADPRGFSVSTSLVLASKSLRKKMSVENLPERKTFSHAFGFAPKPSDCIWAEPERVKNESGR